MKKALLIVGSLLLAVGTVNADQIVKPHTFSAGTPANADEVNADFDTVYDQVNKVGAAINVDATNNVGIGTQTPAGELHVTKPQVVSDIIFTGVTGGDNLTVDATAYNGIGTMSYVVRVENSGPSPDVIVYSSDNGATWSAPTNMNVSGLHIGNNVTIGFASTDGHAYDDTWEWTVSQGFADGLIVADGKVIVKDIAITNGAASGHVLTSDAAGNATWQPTAPDADNDSTNEIQTISLNGPEITLSHNGGFVTLNDDSAVNELQTLSRSGDIVTLSNGGGSVSVADNDSSITNEIQTLSLSGSTISLTNGGSVTIDASAANELNSSVSMSGTTLSVTDPGGVKSVDLAEKLSLGNLADAGSDGTSLFLGPGVGSNDDGGNFNLGVGISSLFANTSGFNNTAVGEYALYGNTIGNQNTAIGSNTLSVNTSGSGNTATGYAALNVNTTGAMNTVAGSVALFRNTTGVGNTAAGFDALRENTSGDYNTGIGYGANYYNQEGVENTIIGYNAGHGSSAHSKSGNVFLGSYAGYSETGNGKLYIDNSATNSPLIYGDFYNNALTVNGSFMSTGNAAIGTPVHAARTLHVLGGATDDYAGYFETYDTSNATGVYGRAEGDTNQAIGYIHFGVRGYAAGAYNNYGLDGVASGTGATTNYGVKGTASGATTNFGVYGYAFGGTTNYAGYFSGNLHVTGNITYVGTNLDVSDERLKENIRPVENGLSKVSAMNGVYFNMKDNPDETEVGVIAQDVEKVLPEAVRVIDQETGYLGVSYPSLIPVLIEAVKELKAMNEAKDVTIAALLQRVEALENR